MIEKRKRREDFTLNPGYTNILGMNRVGEASKEPKKKQKEN